MTSKELNERDSHKSQSREEVDRLIDNGTKNKEATNDTCVSELAENQIKWKKCNKIEIENERGDGD